MYRATLGSTEIEQIENPVEDTNASVLTFCGTSGTKIVEILKKNPKKDPTKYDQGTKSKDSKPISGDSGRLIILDDIDHMRRVVSYCKRHLAQEEKAKKDTSSKSYKSLKNWGHDARKS